MTIDIEKLSERRSMGFIIAALSYLASTLPLWDWADPLDPKGFGWIDIVQLLGMLGFFWSWLIIRSISKAKEKAPHEAAALFDELFQSNKNRATEFGFIATLLASTFLMVMLGFDGPSLILSSKDTAQLIFTTGLVSALLSRAYFERRNG